MKNDIVVIDDDELTLEMLKRRLRNTPVRLQCFTDSQEAMEYLRNNGSDLLLVDHCMPRQSGLEVLQELASVMDFGEMRAFLCSAATLPGEISAQARSLGAATLSKDMYRDKSALLQLLLPEQ